MRQPALLLALAIFTATAAGAYAKDADIAAPAPLDDAELEAMSGGESHVQVLTIQNLSAISSGNTVEADSVSSGGISFGENALSGFTGIGNFVVNTGHNNTLQGSISVSVVTQ